jgi:hypothetical protein
MPSGTRQDENIRKTVHDLCDQLEELVTSCKTTDDLAVVVGVVALTNTYLGRALAIAISSFAHDGVQPRQGEAYGVITQAVSDLERLGRAEEPGDGTASHLRQLLFLQNASSYAAANTRDAVSGMGNTGVESIRAAHLAADAEGGDA